MKTYTKVFACLLVCLVMGRARGSPALFSAELAQGNENLSTGNCESELLLSYSYNTAGETEESWIIFSFSASGCIFSGCLGSGCLLSVCVGSQCIGSACATSGCVFSGCSASGCAGSACGLSGCLGSGCAASVCGNSVCALSACVGSVCRYSGCIGSVCVSSACVGSACLGTSCMLSICASSVGCSLSYCVTTGCENSACLTGCCETPASGVTDVCDVASPGFVAASLSEEGCLLVSPERDGFYAIRGSPSEEATRIYLKAGRVTKVNIKT